MTLVGERNPELRPAPGEGARVRVRARSRTALRSHWAAGTGAGDFWAEIAKPVSPAAGGSAGWYPPPSFYAEVTEARNDQRAREG